MNNLKELKEITKDCTILCVEDDHTVKEFLHEILSGLFKKVVLAENGIEGLSKFKKNKIEMIITDHMMPKMSGIEMITEIRKTDTKTPIILITAYAEKDILLEAINSGATQLLVKPVRVDNLLNAVEIAIQRVVVENQKVIRQEAELLRYKESYHSLQQRLALKKQQHIIRDDFYYKKLDVEVNGRRDEWLINIRYQPHDILSGDFYTIRKFGRDKVLLYIADAMGKGLNAFVTTAIVTSFLNYSMDKAIEKDDFDMNRFVKDFLSFSKKHLSEDEALCALFVFIDFTEDVVNIANFSMPPVFIEKKDGGILKIPNNNLPIMKFSADVKEDRYDVSGFKKMLLCSDGLYDASYQEHIEEDFRVSPFRGILYNKFIERVKEAEDDVTFIFLKRMDFEAEWTKTFVIQSRLDEVNSLVAEVEDFLTVSGFDMEFIVEFTNAFSEIVMNAYEHGSLGIGYMLKNRLIRDGRYEEYLLDTEKAINKRIMVTIACFNESGRNFLMLRVSDEGQGFDTSIIKETVRDIELLHYRGIKIAKGLMDEMHYNDRGNEATLFKGYSHS